MPATLAPNMFLLKHKKEVAAEFLEALINCSAYWGFLKTAAQSSAQPKLNKDNVRELRIVLPPIGEQKEIVRHINREVAKVEAAIELKERQIEALKEYKATLINAAVTGKIKVI